MCKCGQIKPNCGCNKKEKIYGCEKIDAKCVLYKGECLTNLDFCAPEDVETIIKIIDGVIGEIYQSIENFFVGNNVGTGAEVYKGKSITGAEEFRTLYSTISVDVNETENGIEFAVNEEWLTDIINDIVSTISVNLQSNNNSILINDLSPTSKNITFNPNIFTSLNNSVNITSSTTGGQLRVNFNVDEGWIEDVLPTISNVGTGADIYKGLNGNTQEFRGITTNVVQPSNPGQLTGNISTSSIVNGDNVQVNIDFSNLSVPIQQVGIPEYYVHSAADATIADGSVVRPYKTWDDCRIAIIGNRTFTYPQFFGVKVIFLSDISSTQSLSVNGITYEFRGTTFTYQGSETAVIDIGLLIDNTPKNPNNTLIRSCYINLSGSGVITAAEGASTPYIIVRACGYGIDSLLDQNGGYMTVFSGSSIELREKKTSDSNFEITDFGGNPLLDGASAPVYVLRKASGVDVVPAVKGILTCEGDNQIVKDMFYIQEGGQINISVGICRAIYMDDNAGLVNYGSIIIGRRGMYGHNNRTVVRYNTNQNNGLNGQYTPSNTVSLISIRGGASFNTSSNGNLNAYLLGSSNQGGYNGFIELVNEGSQFNCSSPNPFLANNNIWCNYLLYLADNVSNPRYFTMEEVYTRISPVVAIIGGAPGVTGANNSVSIQNGSLERDSIYVTDNRIFSNNTLKTNIQINSALLLIGNILYKSLYGIPDQPNNTAAIAFGLIPGMLYRTTEVDSTFLKITT